MRVASDPLRAAAVTAFPWPPPPKRPLTVAPKAVTALLPIAPWVDMQVRPAVALGRLGVVTTPPGGSPTFRVARRWAWVHYCWAFGPPAAGQPLRLSGPAAALTLHHRQRLSEDLGIAVGLEAAIRYLRVGQPAGTTVKAVDVDDALDALAGGLTGGQLIQRTPGTRMRPDYLLIRRCPPGFLQEIYALECKGTRDNETPELTLKKAAAQVRGVQVGPAPGGAAAAPVAPPGLIAASTINDQRIRVELFDPEGDERWTGDPAPRETDRRDQAGLVEVLSDGAVRVSEPARFRRLLADVIEARLLTIAGRRRQAAERLGRVADDDRDDGPPDRLSDTELGEFEGARLRLPLDAGDVVEVFLGAKREIVEAIAADDEDAVARASETWQATNAARRSADEPDDDAVVQSDPDGGTLRVYYDDGTVFEARAARAVGR